MGDLGQIPITIGVVGFLLCIVGSRILSERALKALEPEKKVALVDAFSGARAYYLVPIALALVLFLVLTGLLPDHRGLLLGGFQILVVVGVLLGYAWGFFTLRRLDLPETYMRHYWISRGMSLLGFVVLGSGMLLTYFD